MLGHRLLVPLWILYRFALASDAYCDAAGLLIELGSRRSRVAHAKGAYVQARTLALKHGCAEAIARSAVGLAHVLLAEQSYEEADWTLSAEMNRIRELNDPRLLAEALLKEGAISDKQGNEQAASGSWREAAAVSRTARYDFGYSEAITNLGGMAYRAHRDDEARSSWLEALDLARRRRDSIGVAELQLYLGIIAVRAGYMNEAQSRLPESRALYSKRGRRELADKAASYIENAVSDADR